MQCCVVKSNIEKWGFLVLPFGGYTNDTAGREKGRERDLRERIKAQGSREKERIKAGEERESNWK